jgi:hypothetical protein
MRQIFSAKKTELAVSEPNSSAYETTPLASVGFPSWTSPVRVRSPALNIVEEQ